MSNTTVMWQAIHWPGIEHFTLTDKNGLRNAYGNITGVIGVQPFALQYEIEMTGNWKVSWFHIRSLAPNGREIKLTSDLAGHWFDLAGNHIDAFDGCIDIDISLTPFTNTLPVKRLSFQPGEKKEVRMLYIKLPEFELQQVQQHYTCLDEHHYRYERYDQNTVAFSADLPFDEDWLVTDYPGIFKRIYPEGY